MTPAKFDATDSGILRRKIRMPPVRQGRPVLGATGSWVDIKKIAVSSDDGLFRKKYLDV